MGQINLLVELNVRPARIEEFTRMFCVEFVARSRDEQGCLLYQLWLDTEDKLKQTIVESWASQADLDRHLAQAWFKIWAPKLETCLESPPLIRTFSLADRHPGE